MKAKLKVGDRVERASGERLYYQGVLTGVVTDGVYIDWRDVRGTFTRFTRLESPADLRLSLA